MRKQSQDEKSQAPKCAYKEQYGVIVICKNETHQRRVYNKLNRMGLKVRVVVT